ncbi:hypothetical protein WR25_01485 [Diploscapter pachys]|uniref:Uncharacterized protein n=1 Tax=Diploscapter pachys TaxID=2018661 RepID=A0A2A2KDE6_9BILA|nr:hypothetical protein WR25_01485 [Diploscapter pachys]
MMARRRAWPFIGQPVVVVTQRALFQRHAATADAAIELVAQHHQLVDTPAQVVAPARREALPVVGGGRVVTGQGIQGAGDVGQGNAQALGHLDYRHPAQHGPRITPLVAGIAGAVDQALGLVEVQGGHGHAATGGQLADAEQAFLGGRGLHRQ